MQVLRLRAFVGAFLTCLWCFFIGGLPPNSQSAVWQQCLPALTLSLSMIVATMMPREETSNQPNGREQKAQRKNNSIGWSAIARFVCSEINYITKYLNLIRRPDPRRKPARLFSRRPCPRHSPLCTGEYYHPALCRVP